MTYLEWNEALAKHFFNSENSGRRVFLYVNEELIAVLGSTANEGIGEFVASVKAGPDWATRSGLCQKALQAFYGWRDRGLVYPPYISYLAFFVLAAAQEGDFAAHAYYPRLRTLLGEEPTTGQYQSFNKMLALWDDLERWTNEDKESTLGEFVADFAGEWIHVGLPQTQTLLSDHERHVLPSMFAQAGFMPGQMPSDMQMTEAVRVQGRPLLRRRTLSLVEGAESDARSAFLDLLAFEFQQWDGTVREQQAGKEGSEIQTGLLVLCLEPDAIAQHAKARLRCRYSQDFPPTGFRLLLADGQTGNCVEDSSGYSTPIVLEPAPEPLDASSIGWMRGLRCTDETETVHFVLRASRVRIFVDGSPSNLSGLVEVTRVPSGTPFYLAAESGVCSKIEEWGTSSECSEFRPIVITRGLPAGWRLYSFARALGDSGIRDTIPQLAMGSSLRLSFAGGIQVARGSRYFTFAPPAIELNGGGPEEKVVCKGQRLDRNHGTTTYEVPLSLATPGRMEIEASSGGTKTKRSLYLDSGLNVRQPVTQWLDRFGKAAGEPCDSALLTCGALVRSASVPSLTCHPLSLISSLAFRRTVTLLGRVPGQISRWPSEPMPVGWAPVWLVTDGRKISAHYCGADLRFEQPVHGDYPDRKSVKRWRDILWASRCRTEPPAFQPERKLWQAYVEFAHDV